MNFDYMLKAIDIAKKSGLDIPVGALIIKDSQIIAIAVNEREKNQDATCHAEILAIQQSSKKLNNWRLSGCEMYVTLEPCPMCASAILQSRIDKVYFGAYDFINGAFGSKCDMRNIMGINMDCVGGIFENECSALLKDYFKRIR